jgi:hypothetical protein
MDYGSHFYLTLPSNSASFPENTLDDFRIKLPEQIKLSENWEVGLVEITYPHTWYNIRGEHQFFLRAVLEKYGNMSISLEPGYYASPVEICSALNDRVSDWLSAFQADMKVATADIPKYRLRFEYSAQKRKIVLSLGKPTKVKQIVFSSAMSHLLGIEEVIEIVAPEVLTTFTGSYPVDIDAGFVALYLYCDLLPNLIIGDTLAPLLRTVNVEGKYDDIVCRSFDFPHYLPLAQREFNTVHIVIKDDMGRPLKFQYGKVVVKLHFRREQFLA